MPSKAANVKNEKQYEAPREARLPPSHADPPMSTAGRPAGSERSLVRVESVDQLVELVEQSPEPLYVRFSSGLDHDESIDHESGLSLPGVSANPLHPPPWWQGPPAADWVTRQVRAYQHLKERDDDRRCWIVTGTVADRGPDNEPLLTDVEGVGVLTDALVEACGSARPTSAREEDAPEDDGSAPWQS